MVSRNGRRFQKAGGSRLADGTAPVEALLVDSSEDEGGAVTSPAKRVKKQAPAPAAAKVRVALPHQAEIRQVLSPDDMTRIIIGGASKMYQGCLQAVLRRVAVSECELSPRITRPIASLLQPKGTPVFISLLSDSEEDEPAAPPAAPVGRSSSPGTAGIPCVKSKLDLFYRSPIQS